MNPFEQKPGCLTFENWNQLYPPKYDPHTVDPYTKCRIILMNGTEFEANWFSHQFARHTQDNDLRRTLAMSRRVEKQQQMKIANLKPGDEDILEHTIGYEQLAVDLTAAMARRETDPNLKRALNFALLEDFDHLYRYADLLEMEQGVRAEHLVGHYTEIMPGRPTISEHRWPIDDIRFPIAKDAPLLTRLQAGIITAAEQQTMNYYMNVSAFYKNDLGRRLYQEIGLIEEQHVSQYESLQDPTVTWLECLLLHEYTECYLYYSCYMDESDPVVRQIWEQCFEQEIVHLHMAVELLDRYEHKAWQQVIPDGTFPELLHIGANIDYVREILLSVQLTGLREDYVPVSSLPDNAEFFLYQQQVNPDARIVPSHQVIEQYLAGHGMDYRFEVGAHPVDALRDHRCDNVSIGRDRQLQKYTAPIG